jgi:hypothetical protein
MYDFEQAYRECAPDSCSWRRASFGVRSRQSTSHYSSFTPLTNISATVRWASATTRE